MNEIKRKLASIRRISEIRPIDGADLIECAIVDGWNVVCKKGEYKVNDLVIYCEIDSWIPTSIAPFLSRGRPSVYMGIQGERLKTTKFRGQISQGLLLPIDNFIKDIELNEDYDMTEILGIIKWEREEQPQKDFNYTKPLHSNSKLCSNFPSNVPKTDQERIQNLKSKYTKYINDQLKFEITEKLDGSSCTLVLTKDGDFKVCSRNLDLDYDESNNYWDIAIRYNIENNMKSCDLYGFAIQGEMIGNKINGNIYKLSGTDFYVFDIYNINTGKYLSTEDRISTTMKLGLKHCPILNNNMTLVYTIQEFLTYADGKSVLNNKTDREGVVAKCINNPSISFKVISNKYLLKN